MDYLYSIILGIIQGLTEFWPVSSSGHLVFGHQLFDFELSSDLSFDVALHLGTLLALVLFFWKDLARYIVAFFRSFANWNLGGDPDQRLAWFIAIGTVPAAVIGYLVADWAETVFRNLWLVAGLLAVFGALFIIFEKVFSKLKDLDQLKWPGAILVGFAQALALVPGVSRSGATILAGLALGLKRESAARFSFLLSIPIVFGAAGQKIVELAGIGVSSEQWIMMVIGFLSSAIVGYLAVKFLMKYLVSHSLNIFAYYRFLLAAVIVIYLLVS